MGEHMNVVLVNPPNHCWDADELAPPLGLLCLSQVAKAQGATTAIVDFNLDSCRGLFSQDVEDFYEHAVLRLKAFDADMLCFTSMGLNSHVSIELARRIKAIMPTIRTVFGGPHFGAIGLELTCRFDWIDHVITGDAERVFGELIRKCILGIREISPLLTVERGAVKDAGLTRLSHPWSAYADISLGEYFEINPRRVLNFESGRGCKYNCAFCYSPGHWLKNYDFDPSQVVRDIETSQGVGAKHLFLVQDNFLNHQGYAASLCAALRDATQRPTWHCYVTLPDIHSDSTPKMLAEAGCTSVYIGLDAVTKRDQDRLGKHFFRNQEECIEKLRALVDASVMPTCAFILDPFSSHLHDLDETFYWAARVRVEGSSLSFHLLTPYQGTELGQRLNRAASSYAGDLRARIMFDCPESVAQNPFASQNPHLFPFHRYPCNPQRFLDEMLVVYFGQHLVENFPFEILDLADAGESITQIIRRIISDLDIAYNSLPDQMALRDVGVNSFKSLLCHSFCFSEIK
jgi:Radical SAM superfamily/B12 binding domain